MTTQLPSSAELRLKFFATVFGDEHGYVCITRGRANEKNSLKDFFFEWPAEAKNLLTFIEQSIAGHNLWFCPMLLKERRRIKDNVVSCPVVWADLDTCHPDEAHVEPNPSIVVESSPGRFQAFWPMAKPLPPLEAEEYARRIAYRYANQGADTSGWDLTQLLRVPYTRNYKYVDMPEVLVERGRKEVFEPSHFALLPPVKGLGAYTPRPLPKEIPTSGKVIQDYSKKLGWDWFKLYEEVPHPDSDWSRLLWRLTTTCFEVGMDAAEVLAVASSAKCNKWTRDNQPIEYLWQDVLRAEAFVEEAQAVSQSLEYATPNLTPKDFELTNTWIEAYVKFATDRIDAPTEYHEVGAFCVISSLLCANIVLETNVGDFYPNLWFMILGETTFTRKSTAMFAATDLLNKIDEDIIVASDATVEGLLETLMGRANKPSLFRRDEVTGLIESMGKKDYMAGMMQTLTQLYDNRSVKRVLKKSQVLVENPRFCFIAGGIKEKMSSILMEEHITSGFLPRFITVSGKADLSSVRPIGRRFDVIKNREEYLVQELRRFHEMYVSPDIVKVGGVTIQQAPVTPCDLTDEAWDAYNHYEQTLIRSVEDSPYRNLFASVLNRAANSMLKMATLIAAIRQDKRPEIIIVEKSDLDQAAYYLSKWLPHTIDLIKSVGLSTVERTLENMVQTIKDNPSISRGDMMRRYRLTSREMDLYQETLEQRGLIYSVRKGKTLLFYAST